MNLSLQLAIDGDYLEVIKYLVKQGAVIYDEILAISARNGNLEIVKFLFTNINMTNEALMMSVIFKRTDVVKFFLEKGANIDNELLLISVKHNHFEITKLLLDFGANNNEALLLSIELGYVEITKYGTDDKK